MGVGEVLVDILVVLLAAKGAAELAERVGIPVVVAEILAGVLVGPSVLGLVPAGEDTLVVLGEIGVILLLLQVGMEMDLGQLRAVGRSSLSVAGIGVALPMVLGIATMSAVGEDSSTALFLGAALAATSVGITARVFSDLRALGLREARTVLGAAVADDVLGLVILTVVVRIVSEGGVAITEVVEILGVALGFLVITTALGIRVVPWLFEQVQRRARSAGTLVALSLAFTLGFAELADAAELAPIIGAFVAGLSLSRSTVKERVERELAPVGHLFIPVFFLQIGIEMEIGEFIDPSALKIAGLLLVAAVIGKVVTGYGASRASGDRLLIGFGMLPRGEVGLIFATIGLQEGVLDHELYASLLIVVLLTTLVAPPLIRWRVERLRAGEGPAFSAPMPAGGWLVVDGTVELAAEPPPEHALAVGLDAALLLAAGERQPGSELLGWLGRLGDTRLSWNRDATAQLSQVLRTGSPRTWRFLETTGLLERALPELAEVLRRRRADPSLLEPAHVLRFSLVETVRELVGSDAEAADAHARLAHPEWLLLAALILDAAGDEAPVILARRLAQRLDLGAEAEEQLALLVGDSGLLRGVADRFDGLDEERVLQVATHLGSHERARALYVLTLALYPLDVAQRERLDELVSRVVSLLDQPELTGRAARNLVERRRVAAAALLEGQTAALDRVAHAPRGYVLSQEAVALARHASLLEPLPGRGKVRVTVTELDDDTWRVEVALRDRPGLLATVSAVLAEHGLDVLDAVVVTWADGGALESFLVRRARSASLRPDRLAEEELHPPTAAGLRRAIEAQLGRPLSALPNPDFEIVFDDVGSPWYTLCEVRSPDRRGLLHSIAVGFAHAGVNVHSARLTTEHGIAVDRFELADAKGHKLTDAHKHAIAAALAGGVTPRRRPGRRRWFRRSAR